MDLRPLVALVASALVLVLTSVGAAEPAGTASRDALGRIRGQSFAWEKPRHGDLVALLSGKKIRVPAPFANVILDGAHDVVMTDELGQFVVTHVPPGSHRLTFKAIGFEPDSVTVNVIAGGIDTVVFELRPVKARHSESL